jgi:hypothetical protein
MGLFNPANKVPSAWLNIDSAQTLLEKTGLF